MKRPLAAALLILLLAGCDAAPPAAQRSPGERLERAARAAEMVRDPRGMQPVGMFASDSDQLCSVPLARGAYRIGVSVDYGDGHRCSGRGTMTGGATPSVDLGQGCRFVARFDGERLRFPAAVPPACERLCRGRASLSALIASQLSDAASEAAHARGPDGRLLCAG